MPQPLPHADVVMVPVEAVAVPAALARRRIDPEGVAALTRSIGEHGLLQPVLVRPLSDGRYELLAGLRRLRAVQAGFDDRLPLTRRGEGPRDGGAARARAFMALTSAKT